MPVDEKRSDAGHQGGSHSHRTELLEFDMRLKVILRSAAVKCLRSRVARNLAQQLATSRRNSLILVYHRVVPDSPSQGDFSDAIVPSVPRTLFREHLKLLSSIGRIVALRDVLNHRAVGNSGSSQIRFAITFDDDEPSHLRHALPVLQSLAVPATFFLSGRALSHLSPPWWIVLEREIARSSLDKTATELGLRARTPTQLAALIERGMLSHLVEQRFSPAPDDAQLQPESIVTLAQASGITIGFHTLSHQPLTALDDGTVLRALEDGRSTLAALTNAPITALAYPHGKSDARVAELARRSGFTHACQSGQRPVSPNTDPMMLSRWEPGPLSPDDLLVNALMRLNLAP